MRQYWINPHSPEDPLDTALFLQKLLEIEVAINPDEEENFTALDRIAELRNILIEREKMRAESRRKESGATYLATLTCSIKYSGGQQVDSILQIL